MFAATFCECWLCVGHSDRLRKRVFRRFNERKSAAATVDTYIRSLIFFFCFFFFHLICFLSPVYASTLYMNQCIRWIMPPSFVPSPSLSPINKSILIGSNSKRQQRKSKFIRITRTCHFDGTKPDQHTLSSCFLSNTQTHTGCNRLKSIWIFRRKKYIKKCAHQFGPFGICFPSCDSFSCRTFTVCCLFEFTTASLPSIVPERWSLVHFSAKFVRMVKKRTSLP